MSVMEYPTEWFCKSVSGIDSAFDELHFDVVFAFPFLDGKVGDIDVARTLCRYARVDNFDGRIVIFIDNGRFLLWESKVMQTRS